MLKSGCAVNVALRSRRKEGQPKGGGKPNRGKKGSPKEEERIQQKKNVPKEEERPREERKAAQKRRTEMQPKRGGKKRRKATKARKWRSNKRGERPKDEEV